MNKKPKSSKRTFKTIEVNPTDPQPELITKAARAIKKGGVLAFPTRYLYGLGADALNPAAVDRVFEIKRRPVDKPLLILVRRQEELLQLVRSVPQTALRVMNRFWPGDVTIVLEAGKNLPKNLTGDSGKIGIRLPQHPVAVALVEAVGGPITATSANLAGESGCSRIADLAPAIAEKLDLILDAGPLKGGIGSTVLDLTAQRPVILREGAVAAKEIFAVL